MRISYGGYNWEYLSGLDFWELEEVMISCDKVIKDSMPNE